MIMYSYVGEQLDNIPPVVSVIFLTVDYKQGLLRSLAVFIVIKMETQFFYHPDSKNAINEVLMTDCGMNISGELVRM
jgi:hypothetical protein